MDQLYAEGKLDTSSQEGSASSGEESASGEEGSEASPSSEEAASADDPEASSASQASAEAGYVAPAYGEEGFDGSDYTGRSYFVQLMNEKAAELGCTNTHFTNPHGLHNADHYSTARDIYRMSKQAMTHATFREIVSTGRYTVPATNLSEPREFYNTNALLSNWHYMGYVYDKAIGVKTGTTPEAGRCLVSAAVDGDEYLIAVILGAEPAVREDGSTDLKQFSESTALLKWGFRNFQRTTISQEDTPVAAVNVTLSQDANQVLVKPVGTLERTLPVDMDLEAIEPTIPCSKTR